MNDLNVANENGTSINGEISSANGNDVRIMREELDNLKNEMTVLMRDFSRNSGIADINASLTEMINNLRNVTVTVNKNEENSGVIMEQIEKIFLKIEKNEENIKMISKELKYFKNEFELKMKNEKVESDMVDFIEKVTVNEKNINEIMNECKLLKKQVDQILVDTELKNNCYSDKLVEMSNEIKEMSRLIYRELESLQISEKMQLRDISSIKTDLNNQAVQTNMTNLAISQKLERIEKLENYLDIRDNIFVWHIGIIDRLEKKKLLYSEYFYGRKMLYKMGLSLWTDNNVIKVCLLIYLGSKDGDLKWPFKYYVNIKVAHKLDQNKCMSSRQCCNLKEAIKNQYEYNEEFVFNKADLIKYGVSVDRYETIIECFVDF